MELIMVRGISGENLNGDLVQDVLNARNEGLLIFDGDTRITFLNESLKRYTGLEDSQCIGYPLLDFIALNQVFTEDFLNFPNAYQGQVLKGYFKPEKIGGKSIHFRLQLSIVDNEFKGGHLTVDPQVFLNGGVLEDFQILSQLFDETWDALIITDTQLEYPGPQILHVNKGFEYMTGYEPHEVIGKTPRILQGPKTEQSVLKDLKQKLRNEEDFYGRTVNYKKDGTEFTIQWQIVPLKNAQQETCYYLGVQRDVTYEQGLKYLLEETQEIAKVGGWTYDLYQESFLVTKKVFDIFQIPSDSELSVDETIAFFHEEHQPVLWQAFNDLVNKGESFNLDLKFQPQNDEEKWVRVLGKPYYEEGKVVKIGGTIQEITTEKETEKALREKQHFIQKVTENSPNLIHVFDYQTQEFVYINGRVKDLLGYSFEEIQNKFENGVFDLFHPDEANNFEKVISKNKSLKDGEINQVEFRMKTKAGDYKWLLGADTPFKRDEEGNVVQILSTIQDITERKQAEQELLENERFIENVAYHSPLIIHIFDYEKWDTVYFNRRMIDELGYSPEEIKEIEKNPRSLSHPDDIPAIRQHHQENLEMGDKEANILEYRVKHKDGHWVWLRNKDTVFKRDKQGRVHQVLGVIEDITEQKSIWQSLEKNVALFRQLFDNAPVGIVMLDKDYRIHMANKGFEHIFGYRSDEVKDSKLDGLIVPGGYEEEASDISYQTMKGEVKYLETVRTDKQGNPVPVLIYGVPVYYEHEEETISIFGIYVDISQRKKVEEDLKKRTQELLRSNAELEQFAYVTSHNLRSPVVNLKSLIQLFDATELKDNNNRYVFQKLHQSVEQIDETLNDLVDIVAKKKELSNPKEEIAFQKLLDKVKGNLSKEISEVEPEIDADFSQAPKIFYLRSFLESILQNLISNALKYRSARRKLKIKVWTERVDDFICLVISDNGSGFDVEKNQEKLFGLYNRFHEGIPGKGMGLYIVKSQAESFGGKVEVESEVDRGTTFYVYLKDFHYSED